MSALEALRRDFLLTAAEAVAAMRLAQETPDFGGDPVAGAFYMLSGGGAKAAADPTVLPRALESARRYRILDPGARARHPIAA